MMSVRGKWALGALVVVTNIVLLCGPLAAGGSNEHKLVFVAEFGKGLLKNPMGTAVNENTGDVYVADFGNRRVVKFGPTGGFILMFGTGVNKTTGGNVCTQAEVEASSVECTTGAGGGAAGQLNKPLSLAMDQASGDVFVADNADNRVDKFTSSGGFVLTIGGKVNKTTGANVCTQAEVEASSVECQPGENEESLPAGSNPHGEFNSWPTFQGNVIAVSNGRLYVAGVARVQELDPSTGGWLSEVSTTALSEPGSLQTKNDQNVLALAVDGKGHIYVVAGIPGSEGLRGVRELDASGKEVNDIDPTSGHIYGLALDSAGHLAVVEEPSEKKYIGALYTSTGSFMSNFAPPAGMGKTAGVAFNAANELYVAEALGHQAIDMYKPVSAAELLTKPLACAQGASQETSVTLDCKLEGEVDAWGVKGTEVWFQWGTTSALGQETSPPLEVTNNKAEGEEEAKVPFGSTAIEGLRPNETLYYRAVGIDKNDEGKAKGELPLTSETVAEATPTVPPAIVGGPQAPVVRSSSAVLSGELNPENAPTLYTFEYGACPTLESCASANVTTVLNSSAYGNVAAALEARELQPGTVYHYRLRAINLKEEEAVGPESTFTTPAEPTPTAMTGLPSAVTATSAVISGTVQPHGQSAVYTFQVGVDNGSSTRYTTVVSGSAGSGEGPVEERTTLTGLQPGASYLYKITAENGYGSSEGSSMLLKTESLQPGLLIPAVPVQLQVPSIKFPSKAGKPARACKHGFKRNKHGRCVKVHRKRRRHQARSKHRKGRGG